MSDENSDGDIEINITGLRPGEKLFEELLIGEAAINTPHPKIKVASEAFLKWDTLRVHLEQLKNSTINNDINLLQAVLTELVSGYQRCSN